MPWRMAVLSHIFMRSMTIPGRCPPLRRAKMPRTSGYLPTMRKRAGSRMPTRSRCPMTVGRFRHAPRSRRAFRPGRSGSGTAGPGSMRLRMRHRSCRTRLWTASPSRSVRAISGRASRSRRQRASDDVVRHVSQSRDGRAWRDHDFRGRPCAGGACDRCRSGRGPCAERISEADPGVQDQRAQGATSAGSGGRPIRDPAITVMEVLPSARRAGAKTLRSGSGSRRQNPLRAARDIRGRIRVGAFRPAQPTLSGLDRHHHVVDRCTADKVAAFAREMVQKMDPVGLHVRVMFKREAKFAQYEITEFWKRHRWCEGSRLS